MVLSETIPPPAADQASDRVASIFTSTPADPRVWIAHGYGIRVGVWNGQLETSDGIGKHRRTRKVPKADRQLVLQPHLETIDPAAVVEPPGAGLVAASPV